jgi:beta-lactamase class D
VLIKGNNALILSSPNGSQFSISVTDCGELKVEPLGKEQNTVFDKRRIKGCMVLYNTKNQAYQYINESRCDSSYLPASTFKIINSLISLEEGAVESVFDTIKWDGKDRTWENWNQDHCMASALKYSVVWFYQELARQVGRENMQKWIDSVDYGNKKMGKDLDKFWLEGDIRISANQQIDFLRKLVNNKLPFKKENQETVKQIMLTDSTANYQIYSKTGWAIRAEKQIGWLVGYVVTIDNTWIFALNIDIHQESDTKYRKEIVYEILREEEIID